MKHGKVRFGELWIDALTFDEALDAVVALVATGRGGAVYTPNVDHVVVASQVPEFRDAYALAELVLCDGQPLLWTSGLVGLRLPAKVSGSDLFLPLVRRAARERLRVYLLGCGPGVAEEAARRLQSEEGANIVGHSAPHVGLCALPDEHAVIADVAATRPDLVLVGLGTPKGELFIARARDRLRPAVALSLGASVDFYVGHVRRAPLWMRNLGLEWLFRLLQEPRRLARRYLVEDPRFLGILLSTLRRPRTERVIPPTLDKGLPPAS